MRHEVRGFRVGDLVEMKGIIDTKGRRFVGEVTKVVVPARGERYAFLRDEAGRTGIAFFRELTRVPPAAA